MSPKAARAPAEYLKERLQLQLDNMKGFVDEVKVKSDCKLFLEPSLNSAQIIILAKGQPVFCKNASEMRGQRAPLLSPTSNQSGTSEMFKIQNRQLKISVPDEHWLEVYEPKSNTVGYALKQNLKAAPPAKKGVDFYRTSMVMKREKDKIENDELLQLSHDSTMTTASSGANLHQTSAYKHFVPFKATAVKDVPFLSGPALSSAVLFELPYKAEVQVIAERLVKDELWYQVSYKRRTGWLPSSQITPVVKKVQPLSLFK